jgi:hypothetical protein
MKIRLTAAGRKLLKKSKHIKLTSVGTFKPSRAWRPSWVSATEVSEAGPLPVLLVASRAAYVVSRRSWGVRRRTWLRRRSWVACSGLVRRKRMSS